MAVTLKIDTSTKAAIGFLEFVKMLPFVKVVEQKEKSPYDPEFVEKVLKSRNSKKRHVIPTENLWESI
jgi:hypothetical protein